MLDIIGHIKIDESKSERVKYFLSSLRSCYEYTKFCKIILSLDTPSETLWNTVLSELETSNCNFELHKNINLGSYGETYMNLLTKSVKPFILNFIEDHFCLINNKIFYELLKNMEILNIDVCKSTFFQIEQNSAKHMHFFKEDNYGKYYINNLKTHNEYQKFYGTRYYIGVNFITKREFALKFWNRKLGMRPHGYEVSSYEKEYEHNCMIPNIEIQSSIDDDHGESNTCLLNRNELKYINLIK